jgi:hypothetical protein
MNVLVVEDDASRVRAFRRGLVGHTVTVTDNPDEAVALMMTRNFHAVFLDYDLDYSKAPHRKVGEMIPKIEACPPCIRNIDWYIHSLNDAGASYMAARLARVGARVRRWPFAWQDPTLDVRINNGKVGNRHAS